MSNVALMMSYLSWSRVKVMKWPVHSAKIQISLGLCPVWSVFAVRFQPLWIAKDPSLLHADNEDSDQIGAFPGWSESKLCAQIILLVLSCSGSFVFPTSVLMSFIRKLSRLKNLWHHHMSHVVRKLVCAFIVHCLDSIIPLVSVSEI